MLRSRVSHQRARQAAMRLVAALALVPGLVLAGCAAVGDAGPLSDTGQAIMIVIASQPIYTQTTCAGQKGTTIHAGDNVIDLGTVGTNCEKVVYLQNGSYSGIGYLPVYGMRRAAGGVRCRAPVDCHLRAGPGTTFAIVGALAPGSSAVGYGSSRTHAIITDGNNFDWWEVVDPASGQRADVFGPNCQAF